MNSITGAFLVCGVVLGGWGGATFGVGLSIVVAGGALLLIVAALNLPFVRAFPSAEQGLR